MAREMTKAHKTYLCAVPEQLISGMDDAEQWRGEIVCVLEGGRAAAVDEQEIARVMKVLAAELAPAQAARIGAQLLPGWAVVPSEKGVVFERIDDFTALVGGAEHDHPPQSLNGVPGQVVTQKDAAHGVGHEMEVFRPLGPAILDPARNGIHGKLFNGKIA